MTDLLNCPFCGSGIDNSHPVPFPVKRDRSVWVARCGNPDCAAEIEAGSPKECTQRWNRRATAAPVVVGEDARDAARYRWLRNSPGAKIADGYGLLVVTDAPNKVPRYIGPVRGDNLDREIDKGMTAALAGD